MASRDPLADPERAIRRVYAYAAYRLGHGADAEDVTGQVIERALRYRSSYDPRLGEPTSWLIGIARKCVDDVFRDRARGSAPEHQPGDVDDLETSTLERLSVSDAVAGLEPRDRELIALRYGADLSTREIARLLDMEPNAIDVALHRARVRLRDELEGSGVETRSARHYPAAPASRKVRPTAPEG